MGILNLTPDSFFDGGKFNDVDNALIQTEQMLSAGASIIDIGAHSTKPGAADVSEEEEKRRSFHIIEALCKQFPEAIFSIDTFRASVASGAVERGVSIINDVASGDLDPEMFNAIAKLQVPYILMHKKGTFAKMQENPVYDDLLKEVIDFFVLRIHKLQRLGIHDIIIDPGFGFGKTLQHNFELLEKLDQLKIFNLPILAGVSRKSMVYKLFNGTPDDALNGTIVANTIALMKGASILRVHDVKQASEAIKMTQACHGNI